MSSEMTSPPEPVAVWIDESGRLMSDLGSVDTQCHATVRAGHCPQRPQCVLLHRARLKVFATVEHFEETGEC